MFNHVLTVCTGNICRSPLAEAQLHQQLPHLTVTSAGIGALVGQPADPKALAVGQANGLDLSAHRGRQLDADIIRANDVMLVMEPHHEQWITRNYPMARGRVFLLGRWQDNSPVPDPYRQSAEHFERVFAQIRGLCADWVQRLAV